MSPSLNWRARKTQNKSKKTSERGKNSLPQIGELKTKLYNNSTNFQLQLRSIPKQIYNLHYDIQPKPDWTRCSIRFKPSKVTLKPMHNTNAREYSTQPWDLCDLSFRNEQPGLYDSPQLVCSQTRALHLRKGYPGAGAFQVKGANQCWVSFSLTDLMLTSSSCQLCVFLYNRNRDVVSGRLLTFQT